MLWKDELLILHSNRPYNHAKNLPLLVLYALQKEAMCCRMDFSEHDHIDTHADSYICMQIAIYACIINVADVQ